MMEQDEGPSQKPDGEPCPPVSNVAEDVSPRVSGGAAPEEDPARAAAAGESKDPAVPETAAIAGPDEGARSTRSRFLQSEIQAIKTQYPGIQHQQAFGLANKRWASAFFFSGLSQSIIKDGICPCS